MKPVPDYVKIYEPIESHDYVFANESTTLENLIKKLEAIRDSGGFPDKVYYVKGKVEIELQAMVRLPPDEELFEFHLIRRGRDHAPGLIYKMHADLNDEMANREAFKKMTGQT